MRNADLEVRGSREPALRRIIDRRLDEIADVKTRYRDRSSADQRAPLFRLGFHHWAMSRLTIFARKLDHRKWWWRARRVPMKMNYGLDEGAGVGRRLAWWTASAVPGSPVFETTCPVVDGRTLAAAVLG